MSFSFSQTLSISVVKSVSYGKTTVSDEAAPPIPGLDEVQRNSAKKSITRREAIRRKQLLENGQSDTKILKDDKKQISPRNKTEDGKSLEITEKTDLEASKENSEKEVTEAEPIVSRQSRTLIVYEKDETDESDVSSQKTTSRSTFSESSTARTEKSSSAKGNVLTSKEETEKTLYPSPGSTRTIIKQENKSSSDNENSNIPTTIQSPRSLHSFSSSKSEQPLSGASVQQSTERSLRSLSITDTEDYIKSNSEREDNRSLDSADEDKEKMHQNYAAMLNQTATSTNSKQEDAETESSKAESEDGDEESSSVSEKSGSLNNSKYVKQQKNKNLQFSKEIRYVKGYKSTESLKDLKKTLELSELIIHVILMSFNRIIFKGSNSPVLSTPSEQKSESSITSSEDDLDDTDDNSSTRLIRGVPDQKEEEQTLIEESNKPAIEEQPQENEKPEESIDDDFEKGLKNPATIEYVNFPLSKDQTTKLAEFMEGKVEELTLINANITNEHLEVLGNVLSAADVSPTLKKLNLNKNVLSPEAIPYLIKILQAQTNIEHLLLSNFELRGKGCTQVVETLISNNSSSLKQLDLSYCEIENAGVSALSKLIKQENKLANLSLSHNSASERTWNIFFKTLKNSKVLRTLSLDKCDLTDTNLNELCESLRVNDVLKSIDIENNCITDDGAEKILKVIQNENKSLTVINLTPGNEISQNLLNDISIELQNRTLR